MDREGNHVDLLIAILIRFPEIGTVHYEPEKKTLRLVFLLRNVNKDFHYFAQHFESHLALFHQLKQENVSVACLKRVENPDLTIIEIVRDLASLSLSELNLVIRLVSDYYGDSLVKEGPNMAQEDEVEQGTLIESLLISLSWRDLERLTGFREDGRVLVFSIPLTGVSKS